MSLKPALPGIACFSILLFLIAVPPAAAGASWSYANIPDPSVAALSADLSGDYLVYTASTGYPVRENSTRVVELYSLVTGNRTRIAVSGPDSVLTGEAISGGYAVFFSEPQLEAPDGIPNRIFLYTIDGGNLTVLPSGAGAEWPKISGEIVLWSESTEDSIGSRILRYDIRTGNASYLPGVLSFDSAGVSVNGRYVLYTDADTLSLRLYEHATGSFVTVFAPAKGGDVRETVSGSAVGGDYVLYRRDVTVETPRAVYSELCLYAISANTTVLVSPLTGKATETLSDAEKNAAFGIGGADDRAVAWYVSEGIANDRIMVLDLPAMAVSSISPGMSVYSVGIDGRNLAWIGTKSLFGRGDVYLATGSGEEETPAGTGGGVLPTKSGIPLVIPLAGTGICCALAIAGRKG